MTYPVDMPSLRKLRRLVFPLVAVSLVVVAFTGAQDALSAKPGGTVAHADKATVKAGTSKTVKVLANDTIAGGARTANVRVIKSATGIKATTTGTAVKVAVAATTKTGTYTLAYRVTGAAKTNDKATIRITVPSTPATTPTSTPTPSPTASPTPTVTPTPTTPTAAADNTLLGRINTLTVAPEVRTGYDRDLFKHWNSGAGIAYCDTRDEVLIAESVIPATYSGSSCTITGQWYSYYDAVTTTDSGSFDIDHMIALAEGWDSGAYGWDAAKREAYANDLGDPRSLVAVTANSNRGKGDQDPAEWLPLKERCRYIGEWVAVKHRWGFTIDSAEKEALLYTAQGCENVVIEVIPR